MVGVILKEGLVNDESSNQGVIGCVIVPSEKFPTGKEKEKEKTESYCGTSLNSIYLEASPSMSNHSQINTE